MGTSKKMFREEMAAPVNYSKIYKYFINKFILTVPTLSLPIQWSLITVKKLNKLPENTDAADCEKLRIKMQNEMSENT